MTSQFFFPIYLRLHNFNGTLQNVFKLLLGSGLLNSLVHDHVLVLQELFAIQSSSGDTDWSFEIYIWLTALWKEKKIIVKKTDETPIDLKLENFPTMKVMFLAVYAIARIVRFEIPVQKVQTRLLNPCLHRCKNKTEEEDKKNSNKGVMRQIKTEQLQNGRNSYTRSVAFCYFIWLPRASFQ